MARRASSAQAPSESPRPILCAVLDAAALGDEPRAMARALFDAGVDWIQLRDRTLETAPLLAIARALVAARDAVRAESPDPRRRDGKSDAPRVVVNKRADVALAAGADGVHLGIDALDARSVRVLGSLRVEARADEDGAAAEAGDEHRLAIGGAPWIGGSLHSLAELEAAIRTGEPLDYVHLAPIWDPRSKPALRAPLGLAVLAEATQRAAGAGILVLAQGGLDPDRAGEGITAGAAGIAVTGIVSQASNRGAAVRALRRALDRAVEEPR